MANYVSNYIWIEGETEEVQKVLDHIAIRPRLYWEDDDRVKYWTDSSHSFSFHSFVTPPDTVTSEEYNAPMFYNVDADGNPSRTNDTVYNANNWNHKNWDTGCDAMDVDIHTTFVGSTQISFQTKWSAPLKVIQAMAQQFPNVKIGYEYEEETGWGGRMEFVNGIEQFHNQWDEPSSHQDYVDRDNEDSCLCAHYENPNDWYDDCPKEEIVLYKVEIVHTHYVKAYDVISARQAVEAYENAFDTPSNTELITYDITPKVNIERGDE